MLFCMVYQAIVDKKIATVIQNKTILKLSDF